MRTASETTHNQELWRANDGAAQKLRVLDLFSGIGGFSLGLERTGGFETVAFCEIPNRGMKAVAINANERVDPRVTAPLAT